MKARVYCDHCERHYEIELKDIKLMQAIHHEQFTFDQNTYHYSGADCFFERIEQVKEDIHSADI